MPEVGSGGDGDRNLAARSYEYPAGVIDGRDGAGSRKQIVIVDMVNTYSRFLG